MTHADCHVCRGRYWRRCDDPNCPCLMREEEGGTHSGDTCGWPGHAAIVAAETQGVPGEEDLVYQWSCQLCGYGSPALLPLEVAKAQAALHRCPSLLDLFDEGRQA